MSEDSRIGERCVALFLLGVLILNPPLLSIFSVDAVIGGVPLVYVYLFAAWSGLVGLVALTTRGRRRRKLPEGTTEEPSEAIR